MTSPDPSRAAPVRPRVAVIGTGGTFAMHARHAFDWVEYGESGVVHPIEDMLGQIESLGLDIDIVPVTFRAVGSTAIVPQDWLELAQLITATAAADPGLAGFVVTHGTATLEETAWFLDLSVHVPQAIVLTGAQRPQNTAGSDALPNLRAALAVAACAQAASMGTVVVMDSMIFAARDVTKAASFELNAFEAKPFGPLGRVNPDGVVSFRRRPFGAEPAQRFNLQAVKTLPRVDLVTSYAGADGVVIDALVTAGTKGIVSVGLPPGRPANGERNAFQTAVSQGVVVVQASRAARGVVPPQAFLHRDGVLAGGDLAPQKLRILLMLMLASTPALSPGAMQSLILESGGELLPGASAIA
ncbi:MAG: asparaginase [Pseudomonadota bacterium]